MNYTQLQTAVKAYSDRYDTEVSDNLDTFFIMAEGRINRNLRVMAMVKRCYLSTVEDQAYYGVPSDFLSIRDIQVGTKTLEYIDPGSANKITSEDYDSPKFYTIIDSQFQIFPTAPAGDTLEIVYHSSIPSIVSNTTNWLGDTYPDIYLAAVLFEINAFVQNKESAALWDQRLSNLLQELSDADQNDRWSGTPMRVRLY